MYKVGVTRTSGDMKVGLKSEKVNLWAGVHSEHSVQSDCTSDYQQHVGQGNINEQILY